MDISIVISKMITLIIYICIGYTCAKFKIANDQTNKFCSKMILVIFLPATILNSVISATPTLSGSEIFSAFLLMFLSFLISGAIAFIYTKIAGLKGQEGAIARLTIVFINNCFVGIPIAEALYGVESSFYISLANFPFNLLLYSFGIADLNSDMGFHFKLKDLFSGPMIATIIAILLFIIKINIPSFICNTISGLAGVTIPLSMMVIGTSLASASIKYIFTDWKVYLTCFVRLIVCPLITWLLLKPFIHNDLIMGVLLIIASCPSAMVLTAVSIEYNGNVLLTSRTTFLSTILSMFTIPLILGVLI